MTTTLPIQTEQYASCVEASKRVRWAIDADVIRGRDFDMDSQAATGLDLRDPAI